LREGVDVVILKIQSNTTVIRREEKIKTRLLELIANVHLRERKGGGAERHARRDVTLCSSLVREREREVEFQWIMS
jgi:hypothetical protein